MQNLFKKANALNSNEVHFQRKAEAGNSDVKGGAMSANAGSTVEVFEERLSKLPRTFPEASLTFPRRGLCTGP